MMIEEKIRLIHLLDFYGQLLTEKQQVILHYYLNDDYSLGEIAEMLIISRQAVYDTLKRSEKSLNKYEDKLKLYHRFESHKLDIKEIIKDIESGNVNTNDIQKKLNALID